MEVKAIQEIREALDRMFPSGGASETIDMGDPELKKLQEAIRVNGTRIPENLEKKISLIESNMCERQPFMLQFLPFLEPEDFDDCETF